VSPPGRSWSRVIAPGLPEFAAFAHAAGCDAVLFGARVEFDCSAHRG
jgi:hypothetical protein